MLAEEFVIGGDRALVSTDLAAMQFVPPVSHAVRALRHRATPSSFRTHRNT